MKCSAVERCRQGLDRAEPLFSPKAKMQTTPIIHPIKTGDIFGYLLFLYGFWRMMGVERRIRKHAGGERTERRRGRMKRGERVAAVSKKQACFDRRSFCRAPQQDTFPAVGDAHVPSGTSPKNEIRLHKSGYHFYHAKYRKLRLTQI